MQIDPKDQNERSDDDDSVSDEEISSDDETVETVVLTEIELTDNVGDVSVEINVEELVAKVEAETSDDASRKKAVRQRLEELAEDQGFEATYALEFEDAD